MNQTFWDISMKGYYEFTNEKLLKLEDCDLKFTNETLKQRKNVDELALELYVLYKCLRR
jgi:beta-glucosidase/6-phospho-beta-glucosidase/beta-galactosidase